MAVYTIAEIGINHDGKLEEALKLIDSAYRAGVNAVKFQYRNPSRCYLSLNEIGDEILYSEIKRCSIEPCQYKDLVSKSHSLGLDVGLSFFLDDDISDFDSCLLAAIDFFKVPSPEFANYQLIDELLSYNKHVVCSTGAQSQFQIDDFIAKYKLKSDQISLLHCVSNYPLEPVNSRLGYIQYLSDQWPGRVGYSSHDSQQLLCIAAVTLGASIIERHITIDKNKAGLDHSSSSTEEEFKYLVDLLEKTDVALDGNKPRLVNQGEVINLQNLGRSYYAARDLFAGELLQISDIVYRSPRVSISTDTIDRYLGKPLFSNVKSGSPLIASHFSSYSPTESKSITQKLKKYASRILVPARLHDLHELRKELGHDSYELHLSYGESLGDIDLSSFDSEERYSIHIPDYIDSTCLIDPFSPNHEIQKKSLKIIDNLSRLAHDLHTLTGHTIPIVGSFSVHSSPEQFYRMVKDLTLSHTSSSYTMSIQILPPFAWYFGGSCRTGVFDSLDSYRIISNYQIPICLDLSHLIMSSNYYKVDICEAYNLLKPCIQHQHIAAAVGYDGEGTPLSTLCTNHDYVLTDMLANSVYSVIEVWQGHLNSFEGFRNELQFLANRQ